MRTVIKKLITLVALISCVAINAENHRNDASPTLVFRSQGRHADRQKMVGMSNHVHQTDRDGNYGVFDMAVGYSRSFREDRLARCLFGTDTICSDNCNPTIKVQGSNAVNSEKIEERDPRAWLADYLYLNCDFVGDFSIKPRIQNVVVDLDLYMGLNDISEGLYARVYGPITWTKWETNFCSTSDTDVTTSCQFGGTGYFTADGSELFLSKVSDYFAGKSPVAAGGVSFQPLRFAKMPNCDKTQAGFADLRAELGYEFFREEDYHVAFNIQAAAPTGNRRRAQFVLDPVVGNGNHWELGGGLSAHYTSWRSEDENGSLTLSLSLDLTHLFSGREQRTFDLENKTNSRYMLASKFKRNDTTFVSGKTSAGTGAPATVADFIFDNEYAPVANLTTMNVRVDVGVQADLVAMVTYMNNGFSLDLGYNFWGRTCEDVKCPQICDPCDQSLCGPNGENRWGLKGDARMFGYVGAAAGNLLTDQAIPLSATQSDADIHGGTNPGSDCDFGTIDSRLRNCGVDNAQFGVAGNTAGTPPTANPAALLIHTPISEGGANATTDQIKTSIQPVLLQCSDIDLQQTRGISHTIFAHLSYTWERDNYTPFIGLGGSAEFGKSKECCSGLAAAKPAICDDDCGKNCLDCALSQWSVWIKGGVSFD